MTLIVRQGVGVINTKTTDIGIGGKVSVGGSLQNQGKIKVYEGGNLGVSGDVLNTGDITINDPEKIKEMLVETVKASKSVAELGKAIIEKFFN